MKRELAARLKAFSAEVKKARSDGTRKAVPLAFKREARKLSEAGLTMEEIGEAIGMTKEAVRHWVVYRAKRSVKKKRAKKKAAAPANEAKLVDEDARKRLLKEVSLAIGGKGSETDREVVVTCGSSRFSGPVSEAILYLQSLGSAKRISSQGIVF